jgi:hypothetical protein
MSEPPDVRPEPDFQFTGDEPMLEQIEAAPAGRVPPRKPDPPGPLEPGEPEWMQYEPDASQ